MKAIPVYASWRSNGSSISEGFHTPKELDDLFSGRRGKLSDKCWIVIRMSDGSLVIAKKRA